MSEVSDTKPGYRTTEFWLTLFASTSAILVLIFGKDFGVAALSQTAATVLAGAANLVYIYQRSQIKRTQ